MASYEVKINILAVQYLLNVSLKNLHFENSEVSNTKLKEILPKQIDRELRTKWLPEGAAISFRQEPAASILLRIGLFFQRSWVALARMHAENSSYSASLSLSFSLNRSLTLAGLGLSLSRILDQLTTDVFVIYCLQFPFLAMQCEV